MKERPSVGKGMKMPIISIVCIVFLESFGRMLMKD